VFGTYTATAHEDNDERLEPTSNTDHPHQSNKQNDSKDVLDAWKVDAENRTKLPRLSHQQQQVSFKALSFIPYVYNLYNSVSNAWLERQDSSGSMRCIGIAREDLGGPGTTNQQQIFLYQQDTCSNEHRVCPMHL